CSKSRSRLSAASDMECIPSARLAVTPSPGRKSPKTRKDPERVRSLGVLLFGLFGVSWIPAGSLGFFPLLDGPFVSLVSEGETEDLVEHPRVVLPVERSVLQNEFGDPVQPLLCSHRTVDQLRQVRTTILVFVPEGTRHLDVVALAEVDPLEHRLSEILH